MGEDNNLEPERTEPDTNDHDGAGTAGDAAAVASDTSANAGRPMTPGQRLAAKKAQKAQAKKEFKDDLKRKAEEEREKEQEEAERIFSRAAPEPALPEEVQKVAGDFTDFMQKHRGQILGGIAAFIGISALVILGQGMLKGGSAEQASALASAIEISNATIDAADDDGKNDEGDPVFKTREDRAAKAAEAFAAAAKIDASSAAAGWAKLGQAALLLEGGKTDEARALYDAVYAAQKGDETLGPRSLEGLGIALEVSGKADEARKRFEELKGRGGFHKDLAEYHLARLDLAAGKRDEAKTLLKGLYDRLSDRPEGTPPSRYLKGEVEIRLAELDPALVDKGTSGGEGQQFSQEELQRLIEQLRQQQQQQGGSPE